MKTKRTKTLSVHVVLLTSIVICFLFISKSYSSIQEDTPILLNGNWDETSEEKELERSLPGIPITVYLLEHYINIQNDKPDCDIAVCIVSQNTGQTAYQQTIPRIETANVLIPIVNFASGEYRIVLTGPGTRHLEGTFNK